MLRGQSAAVNSASPSGGADWEPVTESNLSFVCPCNEPPYLRAGLLGAGRVGPRRLGGLSHGLLAACVSQTVRFWRFLTSRSVANGWVRAK